MQKEEEGNGQSEELTLLDQLAVQVNLERKLANSEDVDLEQNTKLSNEMIDKITYFCTQQAIGLKELAVWSKRADVGNFFNNLNRLRQTLMKVIALTSGREDLTKQADRFKMVMQKFLTLYVLALEEVEEHKDVLDPVSQTPIAMEPDIEEYKAVLEDDIMQEILSTNHLILDLLKTDPTTHPKIKKILEDY